MFDDTSGFATKSQGLATLLYEVALHPMVKGGPLHIARMEGVNLDGEEVEVIGIFKSESTAPFLKMTQEEENFEIDSERGYEIKGMDKGCLIFRTEEANGYRVLVYNANKGTEAKTTAVARKCHPLCGGRRIVDWQSLPPSQQVHGVHDACGDRPSLPFRCLTLPR